MKKLLKNALVIATMNSRKERIEGGDILIEDNLIKQVGKGLNVPDADQVIDCSDKVILPGFVNTHHHFYQTLTRVIPQVQNAKLFDWLTYLYEIWREVTPEAIYYSAKVAISELLLTGCTTTTDHLYLFPEKQDPNLIDFEIKAAKEMGIRFFPTRGSMSLGKSKGGLPPDDVVQTEEKIMQDVERLVNKYHDPSPFSMLRISLAPCSPFSITCDLLKDTVKYAREKGLRCHTHLAETKDEEEFCIEKFGMRPLAYMESLDWIGEDVWFAHSVFLNSNEIKRLSETCTGVAHCPCSNLRLGSGIAPIPEMYNAGVKVGLAVDGSASNDSGDMLGEIRTALLIHRIKSGVASTNTDMMFDIATMGGAKVFGWEKSIGSIEPGKAADLAIFNFNRIDYAGCWFDPVAALIFAGINHKADMTIVNGEILVKDGKVINLDEEDVIKNANKISKEMFNRANKRKG